VTAHEPCLQLDVGNSGAKWRLVSAGSVLVRGRYHPQDHASRQALLQLTPAPRTIWVASVAAPAAEADLAALLFDHWHVKPWFARTAGRTGDLKNSYSDPSRMGVDRWLAMIGARARDAGRLCVVDAGSALTIDIVSATGRHEGGYIIPGPELMERALLLETDRVRFDEPIDHDLTPGTSTAQAVRHGIALAQAGAVALALDAAGPEPPALYFCGGAGQALMTLLDRGGTWAPDLVFEGLETMASAESGASP